MEIKVKKYKDVLKEIQEKVLVDNKSGCYQNKMFMVV